MRRVAIALSSLLIAPLALAPDLSQASCAVPANEIEAENCLTGNPSSQWQISGAGDFSIQGFATEISVDQGQTIGFKVKTDATDYRLDIYRMGYYGGDGARLELDPRTSVPESESLPRSGAAA